MEDPSEKKPAPANKPAAKKPAASKKPAAKKPAAAKKPTTKKPAVKKPAKQVEVEQAAAAEQAAQQAAELTAAEQTAAAEKAAEQAAAEKQAKAELAAELAEKNLSMAPASIMSRAQATLIDYLLLLIVISVAAVVSGNSPITAMDDGGWEGALTFLMLLMAYLILMSIMQIGFAGREGTHNGQTLGKQLMGLRVITQQGGPINQRKAFRREMFWKVFIFWFLLAVPFIGWLCLLVINWYLLFPREGRYPLQDEVCGTLVINNRLEAEAVGEADSEVA